MNEQDWNAYIDAMAKALGLTLTDDMRGPTRANLETAEKMARLVMEHPLGDHAESASIFTA